MSPSSLSSGDSVRRGLDLVNGQCVVTVVSPCLSKGWGSWLVWACKVAKACSSSRTRACKRSISSCSSWVFARIKLRRHQAQLAWRRVGDDEPRAPPSPQLTVRTNGFTTSSCARLAWDCSATLSHRVDSSCQLKQVASPGASAHLELKSPAFRTCNGQRSWFRRLR